MANAGAVDLFKTVGPSVRAAAGFLGTLLVAMVVLGLVHEHGLKSVAKARRSPVISICVGLPATLVIAALGSTGAFIVGSSLGTFFGVPLVILGAVVLPVLTTFGFVAIGATVAARLGRDRLGTGVLVGSLLAGLGTLSLPSAIVLTGLAASLGVGAGIRVLVGAGGSSQPDDRTVPPANKI
ncbi:hypothetical protein CHINAEXTREME_13580 [Halobiforma lacisalsi AJ5]|uniref:Uncharacterized protein n=1 Tax=Natronobacterium lacisalsi AJ5 TaxID=358396 RepID=M0LJQ4_NATLA|nr:hypothetical protein [Halobiforma lacisalsi]APW98751.1 hypothetical protein CHINAEXTREME_13580 [Halobiforma lacisalsi AJ5]EMA32240.1 hypothetical protein C445_10922 [Halobiforma lacisalsi AJ5]